MTELRDGIVWGPNGAVLTAAGQLLDECAVEIGRPHDHPLEYQVRRPPMERTQLPATVITCSASQNYFHWMTDALPRIHLLQKAGVALSAFELFLVNPPLQPFHLETLLRFGIPRAKLRATTRRLHLQVKQLTAASAPGIPGDTPAWASEFLRESFGTTSSRRRKLLISRKLARGRRLRNEEDVMANLPGFESVNLEGLSVREQAGLFASADCVVAPHGAGLTNLLFCRPGSRVVELFSPSYANGCYERLARQTGLSYDRLSGPGPAHAGVLVRDDITVDIGALRRLL